MSWWQNALFWLSRFILRTAVVLAISTAVLVALLGSPVSIQNIVKKSGAYDTFVDRILDESAKLDSSENTVPVNDPKIRKLANNVFTSARLEQIFTKMTDGTYHWLDGEVPQPDFVLNLATEKRAIAKGVSQYAKERVAGLPPCTALPQTTDPFQLQCQPPGINLDTEAAEIEADLLGSDGFLKDTTITFDDFGKNVQQDSLDRVSNIFQFVTALPLYLTGIAVLAAAGVVLTAKSKRYGFQKVARSLLSSGLFLGITTVVFGKLLPAISPSLKAQFKNGSFAHILNNVAWQTVNLIVRETLIYSAVAILIALLIFAALRLTTNRNKVIRPTKPRLKS